ncbi:MAG: WS/DGAT domain-containing protein, partial [Micromonosporaceae bacterium]
VHHSLLDGVAALRLLQRSLSRDPDERDMRPPWVLRDGSGNSRPSSPFSPLKSLAAAARAVGDLVSLAPMAVRSLDEVLREQALPFQAPKSMLNVPITGARRFAAQSWSLERVRGVARKTDATVNDVVLAMCAGALRRYLIEHDALPERPLVAATPVSVRTDGRSVSAGVGMPTPPADRVNNNGAAWPESGAGPDADGDTAVGLILCSLATHLADDAARLIEISNAMRRGKEFYKGRSPLQITALSALPIMPLALYLLPAALRVSTPPFNLVISNVPGPSAPLYFNGARMQGLYPLSLPYEGQALNIAVTRYAGTLEFGLIGCRRSVPHLQRMLGHLEDSLVALESSIR